jgi:hypothetical protein
MRIRDIARQTVFITEDPTIIRKATLGDKYEIVSEETAIETRRKSLEKLKKDAVIAEAVRLGVANDSFINKAEFIDAILEAEAAVTTTDAA